MVGQTIRSRPRSDRTGEHEAAPDERTDLSRGVPVGSAQVIEILDELAQKAISGLPLGP